MTAPNATMSAEDVLKALNAYRPMISAVGMAGGGIEGRRAMSASHQLVMEAVAAMAEREAEMVKEVEALRADAERWQRYLRLGGASIGLQSHRCIRCGHAYSPLPTESEDCPICGCDGTDAARANRMAWTRTRCSRMATRFTTA